MNRISAWFNQPLSRKLQYIYFLKARVITNSIYRLRLKKCGSGCIVIKPIFWTPEYISLGNSVLIWNGSRIEGIGNHGDTLYIPRIEIGDNVSFQQNCHIVSANHVSIGSHTTISFNVLITDNDHQYEQIDVNTLHQPLIVRSSEIGRHCFIGAGAKIQAGTILGDHCVVGANAVVRGKFPNHCVIVGAPAFIVKRLNTATGRWQKTDRTGDFLE